MSTYPNVEVKCVKDQRIKKYYFIYDKNGILTPNACEDANADEECRDCMKIAVDKLMEKYQ